MDLELIVKDKAVVKHASYVWIEPVVPLAARGGTGSYRLFYSCK